MTLLLASASPARRRLLELAAIPHRVQVSGVDEEAITDPSPARLVQKLAQAKAQAKGAGQRHRPFLFSENISNILQNYSWLRRD